MKIPQLLLALVVSSFLLFSISLALAEDLVPKNAEKESAKPGDIIPINENDVRILRRASQIVKDESKWNRHDDRECPPTAAKFSLFCAMWKASVEINGEFDHRLGAMEELRRTVEEASKGKEYQHRLMGYNNDPTTKLNDIHKVLSKTELRLVARLAKKK